MQGWQNIKTAVNRKQDQKTGQQHGDLQLYSLDEVTAAVPVVDRGQTLSLFQQF